MFDNALTISAGLPAVLFLVAGLVPAVLADRRPRSMRAAVVGLAGVAVAAAVLSAALLAAGGPVDRKFWTAPGPVPVDLGVFVDALTVVMLLLVSFVGLVIARFAARALDGEPGQGRFFVWLSLTLGPS
jgi:NAD(P)H-quinone oxidoreductase subunit 5